MKNPRFRLGMVFPTADHFRKVIREYSIISNKVLGSREMKTEEYGLFVKKAACWLCSLHQSVMTSLISLWLLRYLMMSILVAECSKANA